jgi:hypothetical protein
MVGKKREGGRIMTTYMHSRPYPRHLRNQPLLLFLMPHLKYCTACRKAAMSKPRHIMPVVREREMRRARKRYMIYLRRTA